jgi:hypothetical protein
MASFLNNIEFDDVRMSPEQKLWRAVFVQAIQDTFGICTVGMSRDEHREKHTKQLEENVHTKVLISQLEKKVDKLEKELDTVRGK